MFMPMKPLAKPHILQVASRLYLRSSCWSLVILKCTQKNWDFGKFKAHLRLGYCRKFISHDNCQSLPFTTKAVVWYFVHNMHKVLMVVLILFMFVLVLLKLTFNSYFWTVIVEVFSAMQSIHSKSWVTFKPSNVLCFLSSWYHVYQLVILKKDSAAMKLMGGNTRI